MSILTEERIVSVDLIAAALKSEDTPEVYTKEDLHEAFDRYCRFLRLCALYPERPLSPTRDIDMMWHIHMLHPRAYYSDCQDLFGDILDHDGGFGSDDVERPELERIIRDTEELWFQEFGEKYLSDDPSSAKCKTSCKKSCTRQFQRNCRNL